MGFLYCMLITVQVDLLATCSDIEDVQLFAVECAGQCFTNTLFPV